MKKITLLLILLVTVQQGICQLAVTDPGAYTTMTINNQQLVATLQSMNVSLTTKQAQQLTKSGTQITWLKKLWDNAEEMKQIYEKGVTVLKTGDMVLKVADGIDKSIAVVTAMEISMELNKDNTVLKVFWLEGLTNKVLKLTDQAKELAKNAVNTGVKLSYGERLTLLNTAVNKANEAMSIANYIIRVQNVWKHSESRMKKSKRLSKELATDYRKSLREKRMESSGSFLTGGS